MWTFVLLCSYSHIIVIIVVKNVKFVSMIQIQDKLEAQCTKSKFYGVLNVVSI
jgi:hypothetical protein